MFLIDASWMATIGPLDRIHVLFWLMLVGWLLWVHWAGYMYVFG